MLSFCIKLFFLLNVTTRWSFGGNRLQIKAEDKILSDVEIALDSVAQIGSTALGSRKSLRPKHDLARILLANERSRLKVWLFPLEQEKRHYMSSGTGSVPSPEVCNQPVIDLYVLPNLISRSSSRYSA